jgi:hypothetical protein
MAAILTLPLMDIVTNGGEGRDNEVREGKGKFRRRRD